MMDFVNENLIYIVPAGVAAALYIAWEVVNGVRQRRGRRSARTTSAKPGPIRWWQALRRRPERAKPRDDDEFHADAAAQMTRRLEEQAREAQTRHEQRMAEISRTVEKARRLVETSGIGTAAVDLLSTMWRWPEEARASDWSRPAGLYELEYQPPADGEAAAEGGPLKVLNWLWDGSPYRLELEAADRAGAGEAEEGAGGTGSLTLYIEDDTVLELAVDKADPEREDLWTVSDVRALQAGQWMVEFAAFSVRLKTAEEEKRRQLEFERISAVAARIDLGEFDEDKQEEEGDQARDA